MKFFNKIFIFILTGLCKITSLLPDFILYGVKARVLYFVLYYIVRYRINVVRENLRNSFPEKGENELRKIERGFYKHLSEIFIDTIIMSGISAKSIKNKITYISPDNMRQELIGKSWICAMAHYGSWEYTVNYQMYNDDHKVMAVYRPLHNEVFDRFYFNFRSRFGVTPVAMRDVAKNIITAAKSNNPIVLAMIADQTPPWFETKHSQKFLNQDTTFFLGMEKLALKFNLPIYFLDINKISSGKYVGTFELLYDGNEDVAEFEITDRYAARLERMIKEKPELWMWSHRRWKHKKRD